MEAKARGTLEFKNASLEYDKDNYSESQIAVSDAAAVSNQ